MFHNVLQVFLPENCSKQGADFAVSSIFESA
jgi:hypothetical protein